MTAKYSRTDDFFVNTADLSARRPPPRSQNAAVQFLKRPIVLVSIYLAYVVLILVNWDTLHGWLVEDILDKPPEKIGNGVEAMWLGFWIALPYLVYSVINAVSVQVRLGIPFFRNIDFLSDITQVVFLFAVVAGLYTLMLNVKDNTQIPINWNVVSRRFSVEVSEGPDFNTELTWLKDIPLVGDSLAGANVLRPGTATRALMTGVINTLRAVLLALVFSTLLGIFVGIGLLSNNWLVRNLSTIYVEIFRNTPLLVQLFFIFRGLLGVLPTSPREAYKLGDFYLSGRGLNFPKVLTTDTYPYFLVSVIAGLVVGAFLWRWRLKVQDETGKPANTLAWFSMAFLGLGAVGLGLAFAVGGSPFKLDYPVLDRFNFSGGSRWSSGYLTLVVGLTLYTGAFIADIVRAGIQSVSYGQIEAARAHGLTSNQTLRLVVLPQAMRLIVPPLTNQYLNLSKNSSLAIAIGFYDLYNVATVVQNQTGQAVALFAILMGTYLVISLLISLLMNMVNRSMRLKTR
ncbi:MAG: polar amino acid ABC transporter permease [Chloroflexi bacterium]|nr:polar amino acid ABC transporter permease [Chloroflexota bacterium]